MMDDTSWTTCSINGVVFTLGVRTVMENLEKSWHFKMVIYRPGKVMEKT